MRETIEQRLVRIVRPILCRRVREYRLVPRSPDSQCDGAGAVCGMCDVTARIIAEALVRDARGEV